MLNVLYSFSKAARSDPVIVVLRAGSGLSMAGGRVSSSKGMSSPSFDREVILRRRLGLHCWIVVVWYRNGRSVLDWEMRERDNARVVHEHIDIDKNAPAYAQSKTYNTSEGKDREQRVRSSYWS